MNQNINIDNPSEASLFDRMSFRNPAYLIYFGGMLFHTPTVSIYIVVNTLLAYRIAGSAEILGSTAIANAIPLLILGYFGGIIADHLKKRSVILTGEIAFTVIYLGIAVALTSGYLSTENDTSSWIIITVSVIRGIVTGLTMPSQQAIVPEIVKRSQLMNAVSSITFILNVVRLFIPLVAGILIDELGFAATYYIMAGMSAIAVVFFFFLPRTNVINEKSRNIFQTMLGVFQYIRHNATVVRVLIFTFAISLLMTPYLHLLPVFSEEVLNVDAEGMGIMMGYSGQAAIFSAFILAFFPNRKRGLMLIIIGLLLGFTLTGFSFSSSWTLSLAFIAVVGFGSSGQTIVSTVLMQYYTDHEYMGRVTSFLIILSGLGSLITLLSGFLYDNVGVQWAVGGAAILLSLISILVIVLVPGIRRLV